MLIGKIKNTLKKRLWVSFLDIFGYFLFSTFLLFIFVKINLNDFGVFAFLIGFIIYYGSIPKATKGYTLLGYFFKLRIISLNNKEISLMQYLKRAIYAIASPFKFFFYTKVKSNKKGQFYYDKPYSTTVIFKKINFTESTDKDERYYNYFFWGENIQYIFYAILSIFGLAIVKYIINLFF